MSDSDTSIESSRSDIDPPAQPSSSSRIPVSSYQPSHPSRHSSLSHSRQRSAVPDPVQEQSDDHQRRANMIAMDRKRRLTASATESNRRRHMPPGRLIQEHEDGEGGVLNNSGAATEPEIIDLTSSPPMGTAHLPGRDRHTSRTSSSSSRRYVVPRWQGDSEVNQCPICHKPFTWLFRRHHCRKCGRVVCSECSPHRITIPRQFIVNPPDLESFSPPIGADGSRLANAIDLTGDDDGGNDDDHRQPLRRQYLGGGEKVRLCNPCVPDPQPEPQPNFLSEPQQEETRPGQSSASTSLMGIYRPHTNILGQISRHQPSYVQQSSSVPSGFGPRPSLPSTHSRPRSTANFDDILSGGLSTRADIPQRIRTSSMAGSGYVNNPLPPLPPVNGHGRYASLDSRPRMPSDPHRRSRGNSLYAQHMRDLGVTPPAPRPSRPRINEEDMCPICRRELPAKGLDGDETSREAHIMECITSRDPATRSGGEGSSSRPGMLYMNAFTATEKDCLGEDGGRTECSICMVEYDPGDELARLECFCKFHKECIVSWLNRKAECPVHKASSMHY